ncbi:hypothetical protein BWQ96_00521 [Gracilariopsis chorda]|uniref:Uncharacterized protein n=1 Tax=Gracilariopsis chorda TaxID=448386 RepID=A0A2V3J5Q3_9FLOR|nr:hypothetical protein BWQ96_00521 [Gracilariopsis chorda]|eukprot:PXF49643.1 hypothetical protein BWQ96_00521 [Gracilariopsis chorda]
MTHDVGLCVIRFVVRRLVSMFVTLNKMEMCTLQARFLRKDATVKSWCDVQWNLQVSKLFSLRDEMWRLFSLHYTEKKAL